MTAAVQLILGALSCLAFVLVVRRFGSRRELIVYAVSLALAAFIYIVFVAAGGASLSRTELEFGGLVLFSPAALLGARGRLRVLIVGWAVHPAWDVLIHRVWSAGLAPEWYPVVCVGFDLSLAAYIGARGRDLLKV